jgi:transposase
MKTYARMLRLCIVILKLDSKWKEVIWSDETKINRLGSDGREWIWKKQNNSNLIHQHVKGTLKFGGGSLMMWGCITAKGVGYACRIDHRMDAELHVDMLNDYLIPTLDFYKMDKERVIFQQDNNSKHTSHIASNWLDNNGIEVLQWPLRSPDISPIENIWRYSKNKLADYEDEPSGMLELWELAETEWNKIPPDFCMKLIKSMPKQHC